MAPSSADLVAVNYLLALFVSRRRLRRGRLVLPETGREQRQRDDPGLVSCTRAVVVVLAVPVTAHQASYPAGAELDLQGPAEAPGRRRPCLL